MWQILDVTRHVVCEIADGTTVQWRRRRTKAGSGPVRGTEALHQIVEHRKRIAIDELQIGSLDAGHAIAGDQRERGIPPHE